MKPIQTLLLAILCLIAAACKKESNTASIVGKWRLTETYLSVGGPGFWRPVTDKQSAELVEFTAKGTYKNNGMPSFNRYEVTDSVTLVVFSSVNTSMPKYFYHYKIQNQSMILSPTAPNVCFEGCASKYTKISD